MLRLNNAPNGPPAPPPPGPIHNGGWTTVHESGDQSTHAIMCIYFRRRAEVRLEGNQPRIEPHKADRL